MIVVTKNSTYKIDPAAKKWERLHTSETSGNIRTESGEYADMLPLEVGGRMILVMPALLAGAAGRLLTTSPIVAIIAGGNNVIN